MLIRILGAVCVLAGCGAVGYAMSDEFRRTEQCLRSLENILRYMIAELQFRMTPLPELCRMAAESEHSLVSELFVRFSEIMQLQTMSNAERCMQKAVEEFDHLPPLLREKLQYLGQSLGRFDLQGQTDGLAAVAEMVRQDISGLRIVRKQRLQGYATLSLCAGAALVILFI